MNNKMILAGLSLDLMRVANGFHSGSIKVGKRFSQEAIKQKNQIDIKNVEPQIKKLLLNLESMLSQENIQEVAEDALMYSVLFQNYAMSL